MWICLFLFISVFVFRAETFGIMQVPVWAKELMWIPSPLRSLPLCCIFCPFYSENYLYLLSDALQKASFQYSSWNKETGSQQLT